jgi:hypothetical protein
MVNLRALWQDLVDVSCGYLRCLVNKYFTTMRHQPILNQIIWFLLLILNPETSVLTLPESNLLRAIYS